MSAISAGMSSPRCQGVTSPYRLPAFRSEVVSAASSNHGCPASRLMKRCPTVPVAPRTATLRLRIASSVTHACARLPTCARSTVGPRASPMRQAPSSPLSSHSTLRSGTPAVEDGRAIGTVAHHVAPGYAIGQWRVIAAASGYPQPLQQGAATERNAAHAAGTPAPDRDATLRLLRTGADALESAIRSLRDDQLDEVSTDLGSK